MTYRYSAHRDSEKGAPPFLTGWADTFEAAYNAIRALAQNPKCRAKYEFGAGTYFSIEWSRRFGWLEIRGREHFSTCPAPTSCDAYFQENGYELESYGGPAGDCWMKEYESVDEAAKEQAKVNALMKEGVIVEGMWGFIVSGDGDISGPTILS